MADYIREIRKLVGHRPIIMVGAAVLIVDGQGRLLLHRRTDNHLWGIPGGAMEPGETAEETARRETREETGLDVGKMELFGVFSGPEFFYEYPNGDQVYNVSVVYLCRDVHGSLSLNTSEGIELRYFAPEHLPDEISPPVKPVLRDYKRRNGDCYG